MGTWITLHYGGPITVGLKESLCGLKLGEPETWESTRQAATYRDYELLSEVPANYKPCPTCRAALDFWRSREIKARKVEQQALIQKARKRIPVLIEEGKWERVETLAHNAAMAKRYLKRPY